MKRKAKLYVADILDNINVMGEIIGALSFEQFMASTEKKYALVRCIEIIGEAVKKFTG